MKTEMAVLPRRRSKFVWVLVRLAALFGLAVAGFCVFNFYFSKKNAGEIIDPGVLGSVPVIAVDGENNPHVIFYELENKDLKYAYQNGGSWQTETVDSEGDIGDGHDVAIDQNGNPHVSYRDKTNGSVKYAAKINGSWKIEVLDTPAGDGESVECSSIEIDSRGNPHVAYNIQTKTERPSYLKYARWDGNSWNRETLEVEGHWPDLGLDHSDHPHIVFHNGMEMQVYYTTKMPSGNWETMVIDSSTSVENDPRIVVDSKGRPHAAYRGNSDDCPIKYASWDGESWSAQTVAAGEAATDELDLAIAGDDTVYLVFGAISQGTLLATRSGNSEWVFKTAVPSSQVCAVAADQLSRAHIAFTYGADKGGEDDSPTEEEIIKYILVEK